MTKNTEQAEAARILNEMMAKNIKEQVDAEVANVKEQEALASKSPDSKTDPKSAEMAKQQKKLENKLQKIDQKIQAMTSLNTEMLKDSPVKSSEITLTVAKKVTTLKTAYTEISNSVANGDLTLEDALTRLNNLEESSGNSQLEQPTVEKIEASVDSEDNIYFHLTDKLVETDGVPDEIAQEKYKQISDVITGRTEVTIDSESKTVDFLIGNTFLKNQDEIGDENYRLLRQAVLENGELRRLIFVIEQTASSDNEVISRLSSEFKTNPVIREVISRYAFKQLLINAESPENQDIGLEVVSEIANRTEQEDILESLETESHSDKIETAHLESNEIEESIVTNGTKDLPIHGENLVNVNLADDKSAETINQLDKEKAETEAMEMVDRVVEVVDRYFDNSSRSVKLRSSDAKDELEMKMFTGEAGETEFNLLGGNNFWNPEDVEATYHNYQLEPESGEPNERKYRQAKYDKQAITIQYHQHNIDQFEKLALIYQGYQEYANQNNYDFTEISEFDELDDINGLSPQEAFDYAQSVREKLEVSCLEFGEFLEGNLDLSRSAIEDQIELATSKKLASHFIEGSLETQFESGTITEEELSDLKSYFSNIVENGNFELAVKSSGYYRVKFAQNQDFLLFSMPTDANGERIFTNISLTENQQNELELKYDEKEMDSSPVAAADHKNKVFFIGDGDEKEIENHEIFHLSIQAISEQREESSALANSYQFVDRLLNQDHDNFDFNSLDSKSRDELASIVRDYFDYAIKTKKSESTDFEGFQEDIRLKFGNESSEEREIVLNFLQEAFSISNNDNESNTEFTGLDFGLIKYLEHSVDEIEQYRSVDPENFNNTSEEFATQIQNAGPEEENQLTLGKLKFNVDTFSLQTSQEISIGDKIEYDEKNVESLISMRLINSVITANSENLSDEDLQNIKNRLAKPFLDRGGSMSSTNTVELISEMLDISKDNPNFVLPESFTKIQDTNSYSEETKDYLRNKKGKILSAIKRKQMRGIINSRLDEAERHNLGLVEQALSGSFTNSEALNDSLVDASFDQVNDLTEKEDLAVAVDQIAEIHAQLVAEAIEEDVSEDELGQNDINSNTLRYATNVNLRAAGAASAKLYGSALVDPRPHSAWFGGDFGYRILERWGLTGKALGELGVGPFQTTRERKTLDKLMPVGIRSGPIFEFGKSLGLTNEGRGGKLMRLGGFRAAFNEADDLGKIIIGGSFNSLKEKAGLTEEQVALILSESGIIDYDGLRPDAYSNIQYSYKDNYYNAGIANDAKYKRMLEVAGYSETEITDLLNSLDVNNARINGRELNKLVRPGGRKFEVKKGSMTDYWRDQILGRRVYSTFTAVEELKGTPEDQMIHVFEEQGRQMEALANAMMEEQISAFNKGEEFTFRDIISKIKAVENVENPGKYSENRELLKRYGSGEFGSIFLNGQEFDLQLAREFVYKAAQAKEYMWVKRGIYNSEALYRQDGVYLRVNARALEQNNISDSPREFLEKYAKDREDFIEHLTVENNISLDDFEDRFHEFSKKIFTKESTLTLPEFHIIVENATSYDDLINNKHFKAFQGNTEPEVVAYFKENFGSFADFQKAIYLSIKLASSKAFFENARVNDLYDRDRADRAAGKDIPEGIEEYFDPNMDIVLTNVPQVGHKNVKALGPMKRTEMTRLFGDPRNQAGEDSDNKYTMALDDFSPEVINSMDDAKKEKFLANLAYFEYQVLKSEIITQMKKAAKGKDKWIGIMRAEQVTRWVLTLMLITAMVTSGGTFGFMLSGPAVALLLIDYFVISDSITGKTEKKKKERIARIQAMDKVLGMEQQYEQVVSNPMFSNTAQRQRLETMVKHVEHLLESSQLKSEDIEYEGNFMKTTSVDATKDLYGNLTD